MYKSLITRYKNGGASTSGRFIPQDNGWVGIESGKDPREGYFEFTNNRFSPATSPDIVETCKLINELKRYNEEIQEAYIKAESDSDNDFSCLGQLLKENLYSWWD